MLRVITSGIGLVFLLATGPVSAEASRTGLLALYAELLERYTSEGEQQGLSVRLVDYAGLRADGRWPELVQALEDYPLDSLDSDAQRMAFYLNAYNILAINKVLEHWPVRSLRSVGSLFNPVWRHDAGVVGGQQVTLSYLEHEVLRAMGDPRVHMAINCASLSCPDLRAEPYYADTLEQQLDEQAVRFLHQDGKGVRLDREARVVRLSPIFDWFEEDFEPVGGVDGFVRRYRPDLPGNWPLEADLPYRWSLNGQLSARELRALRDDF